MQIIYPHQKFYQIKRIDERKYSPEAYERYDKIRLFFKLIGDGCKEKTALEAIKTSRATLYRWIKRYQTFNLAGLENESRRPNSTRKKNRTPEIEAAGAYYTWKIPSLWQS